MIAIINTWSDINHCHTHFRQRAEEVKRGIWQAGGFPLEMPAMALAETMQKPTTMMYRNFLAMETEELLRSYPVDGCVLMGGCDKTTPALIMGATSMNLPAIYLPAGPMLNSHWRDQTLGSGSDTWKYWDELRAGRITERDWQDIEDTIARSPGTCMTMGTAATMMSLAEALGFTLPGYSSIPAPDSNHARMATLTGKRIVEMVWEDLKPRDFLSKGSFDNAITTLMAMGGSTNAVVHLVAMAGRAGLPFSLERYNEISAKVPVIANVRPSGDKYLMEDFFYAGGLRALLFSLKDLLDLNAKTVNGKTLGENIEGAKVWNAGRDPAARQAAEEIGRPGDAARQPRARRRGAEDQRRRSEAAAAHRARGGVRGLQRHVGAHRPRRPRRRRQLRAGAEERRARWAARASPSGACCRCRRSSSSRASRTWCGSRTAA